MLVLSVELVVVVTFVLQLVVVTFVVQRTEQGAVATGQSKAQNGPVAFLV